MARTAAGLPKGLRITDCISLGVITKRFPMAAIQKVLQRTGKASIRQRDLPAYVVVYYVIALALYMQSSYREVLGCLLEGLQWLLGSQTRLSLPGKSGISQARRRLGWEPLRQLHDELVAPIATPAAKGARYRKWYLASIDGSTLDVADEKANAQAFGRPPSNRGQTAAPQIRFVSLVENGTHVLYATRMGGVACSETALAKEVLPSLRAGVLCLADRTFFGFELWSMAQGTGADLLWRVKKNLILACDRPLPDGSFLSTIYPSPADRRHRTHGVRVRVIEYRLDGVPGAEPLYRLVTTILDPEAAPAAEMAALYHERRQIETALDEIKTHLPGAKMALRSKQPDLVRQEFYGLMLAHFAIRGLMHEAAAPPEEDPGRLAFIQAVRVVGR